MGIEFLQAVRAEHPDSPFILYTRKGSEAVASEAIAADVIDHLQKQSSTEQYELLANRIGNAVQSRRKAERAERQEQLMRLTEFAGDTGGFEVDTETGHVVLTDGARRILNISEGTMFTVEDALAMADTQRRVQEFMHRAREANEELEERDPTEQFDNDDLDDLF